MALRGRASSARSRKKVATRGRSGSARKKASRKKPVRKKTSSASAARKKAGSGARSAAAAGRGASSKRGSGTRKVATRSTAPSLESIARRIVRAARDFNSVKLEDLYDPECISTEPGGGPPAEGLAAIADKARSFEALIESAEWKPRRQWLRPHAIAIEWEAKIRLKSGREVAFEEVAVHDIRRGRIVSERYYYDPAVLASALDPTPAVGPSNPPVTDPEPPRGPTSPPPDPLDL